MRNLSKNTKTLILSCAGLIVLIAAALILLLTQNAPEPDEPDQTDDTAGAQIALTDFNTDDVVRISVRNPHDEYIIERNGNGGFGIAELLSAPLHETRFDAALRYVAGFRAIRIVEEDAEDLEQYGLGADAAWFKAEFANGESFEIYIGDPTPTTEPMSYIRIAGEDTVYIVWSYFVNNFREDRRFYVSLELTLDYEAAGMPLAERMVIEHTEGETFIIERIPLLEDIQVATSLNIHRMIQPYQIELSHVDSIPLLNGFFGLRAERVSYVGREIPDEGTVVAFVEMTVDGRTESLEIRTVREETEDGAEIIYKAVYSEIPEVLYVFNPASLPWLSFDIEQIMSTLFHLPNIFSVSDFIIETSEHNLHFTLQGNAQDRNEAYFLHGELIDTSEFKQLYQYCISASADALFNNDPAIIGALEAGELPLLTRVTYRYRGGSRADDVIEFYDSGDRRTLIVKNGEPLFSSRMMYITRLEQNIEAYLAGERLIMSW
jgi:hypothetical protein